MTGSNPNPAFLKEQAQAMLQQNQLQPAKAMYTRICEIDGGDAQSWHMLGVINVHLGSMEEAAAAWRQAVAVKPDFAEGHCNLANALFCLGRREEAVEHYRQTLRLQPDYSEALNNMGTALNELNRLDEAAQCYETALGLAPTALLHYNLANVRTRQQRLGEAVTQYQRALALEPERPELYNNLGNALRHLGRYADAEASYREALKLQPDHAMAHEAHANLGTVLLQLNRYDEAQASYAKALALKPDFPAAVAGQANVLEKQGQYEQAHALLRPYLDADAADANMILSFAYLCRHVGRSDEAVQRMERMLAGGGPALDVYDHILLHFAVGKLLDAAGEYDRAFDHYRQGNALADRRFDLEEHVRHTEAFMETYSKEFMARAPRAAHRPGAERLVFIVGMPRSGTSLVEQILASHPAVFGAGELEEIYAITTDLPAALDTRTPYPRCVESLTADQCGEQAQRYLDYVAGLASPEALRVTDKMPANFLHLGLINQLFPEARIIHCVRDPLDTCLSCYFQHFAEGQSFTYDLAQLGAYYRQYRRLMAHWREVIDLPMMEVRYEDLVADQEGISRALVQFCGLDWDERCLRFHETRRLVATASYDQVRQPLYDRSVERWRHYEGHLAPLRKGLDEPAVWETSPEAMAHRDPQRDAAYSAKQRAFKCLQAGELDEAKALYSEASRLNPEDGEAWFMLGTLNGQLGLVQEAEGCLRRAVALQPGRPEAHFNLGKALEDQGHDEQALACYRQAVQLKPDFTAAHAQLGNLLQAQGQHEEAVASQREVVRLAPEMAEAHYNLGNAYKETKRYAEAIAAYRQALWLKPDFAEAHNNLGLALTERYQYRKAEAAYREALQLRPDFADAFHNLANLLNKMGRYIDAILAYRESLRLKPDQVDVLNNLGTALIQIANLDEAMACHQRAAQIDPGNRRAAIGEANILEKQGRHEQAYARLRPFLDAEHVDAFTAAVFAAMCRPLGRCDEAIALLEQLLAQTPPLSDDYRAVLHGELGNLYDKKGEYETAFANVARGNEIKARLWPFDIEAHHRRIEALIKTFTRDFLAAAPRATHGSERPVFIVGMPRSGTSLVEQILASHPDVFGAGELEELHRIVAELPAATGSKAAYPQAVQEMTVDQCDRLAARYLDHLSELAPPPAAARVTDKMPSNFLHLGLIAMLFPEARIIHCVRDPLDTCLSCFFQNFSPGLSYTFDLDHLGTFYRNYRRLMTHWQQVLDTPILEVRYEDLVNDQEAVSRGLVEHCGLAWDERCLRFHETSRAVATASYDQVRQPLYSRSVERWRHYERQLEPLRRALAQE